MSRYHYEKDNGRCEKVNFLTAVCLCQMDLRAHVAWSSKFGLEKTLSCFALDWSCETKVCNFEIECGVKHQVLWLEISMCDSLKMHMVEGHHELFEEMSGEPLLKLSRVSDEIEQFTTLGNLKYDVVNHLTSGLASFILAFLVQGISTIK
jgi:hypothetical protein